MRKKPKLTTKKKTKTTLTKAGKARGRPKGGSAAVVHAILEATLADLLAHGFHDLSVERIGQRARVNKTSIYRRFPDKTALVLAAWLQWRATQSKPFVARGEMQSDLREHVTVRNARLRRPEARSFTRAIVAMDGEEVAALAEELHRTAAAEIVALLMSEQARGVLEHDAPVDLVSEMLLALVHYRGMWRRQSLADDDIARAIAVVLDGVRGRARPRSAPGA